METASGVSLKELAMRWGFYALGFIVILLLLFGIILALLKPKLMLMAKDEMAKYGVEAQSLDMSLLGSVHLRDIAVPLHDGGIVRIGEVSARPPVRLLGHTWLGSDGVFYNLRVEKGGLSVTIPELRFGGLSIGGKNPAISSRGLQMMDRVEARSLSADKIELAFKPKPAEGAEESGANSAAAASGANSAAAASGAGLQTSISGFRLSGLSKGKISRIAYSGMDSNAARAAGGEQAQQRSGLRSGAFLAENLDGAALYALAKNLLPQEREGREAIPFPEGARGLIGKIRLHNVDVLAEDEKFGSIRLQASELGSNGFALKGQKSAADFISAAPAEGGAAGDEKKQIIIHNLRGLLADIASLDIETQNVQLEVTPRHDEAADAVSDIVPAAPAPAAKQAEKPLGPRQLGRVAGERTVGDILSEEQTEKPAPPEPWKKNISHLPLHFRLGVSAFTLTANHWEQAIPYGFYIKVKDLSYWPGRTDNGLIRALQAAGHKDLQISLLGDIEWDSADSSLTVKQLAFYGRDMGGVEMQGKFLDIPRSFFDGKAESLAAALNEAALANMQIVLQDNGALKGFIQWGTEQMNMPAKELQEDLHDIAVKSPPLLLKNRQEAQSFSQVFGAFVDGSGSARISLSAPQPGGLKWSDILSGQDDLAALLDKLKLSADRPETAMLLQ